MSTLEYASTKPRRRTDALLGIGSLMLLFFILAFGFLSIPMAEDFEASPKTVVALNIGFFVLLLSHGFAVIRCIVKKRRANDSWTGWLTAAVAIDGFIIFATLLGVFLPTEAPPTQ